MTFHTPLGEKARDSLGLTLLKKFGMIFAPFNELGGFYGH